jgi:tol-pal system protein YbgF
LRVERVVNNDSLLDLSSQVAQMRTEVNQLRGEIETNRFDIEGNAGRSREQYLDLDERIQSLQKGGIIAPGGSGDVVTGEDPRAAYQAAFDLLQARRYDEARLAFNDFLKRYPDNSLADNAFYWLGETSYVSGNFDAALKQFRQVVEKYPGSLKISDAMLKIGFSQFELKDFAAARATLEQVVSDYPDSTASRLAGQRLEQMTRDGR